MLSKMPAGNVSVIVSALDASHPSGLPAGRAACAAKISGVVPVFSLRYLVEVSFMHLYAFLENKTALTLKSGTSEDL